MKYTAEEVRKSANWLYQWERDWLYQWERKVGVRKARAMLTAYADSIERALPVAKIRHFNYSGVARDGFSQEAQMLDGAPELPDGTELFTHPPAQVEPTEAVISKAVEVFLDAAPEWNDYLVKDGMRAALRAVWPNPPAQAVQSVDAFADRLRQSIMRDTFQPTAEPVAQPADSGRVTDGWVLVPREPTKAMLDAAMTREDDEPLTNWGKIIPAPHAEIYKAMLAAAPQPGDP